MAVIVGALVLVNIFVWGWREARFALSSDPLKEWPPLVLWAWERPEDLSFADCGDTGVAYLADTITISRGSIMVRPRLQPLEIPAGCRVMAVVRIEANVSRFSKARVREVADLILTTAKEPRVSAVQVDFDATVSQRPFYAAVLRAVREGLPPSIPLSMTALASWCIHDDWIRELPVDEAVPMLFRMGTDEAEVRRYLKSGNDFRVPACRYSVGVSTDESLPRLPAGRRVYAFHDGSWTSEAVTGIRVKVEAGQ